MVQILRNQPRNYAPDLTRAIGKRNIASAFGDASNVLGATRSIIGAVENYQNKEAQKKADEFNEKYSEALQRDVSQRVADIEHNKGIVTDDDWNTVMNEVSTAYGTKIDNVKFREAFDKNMTMMREKGLTNIQETAIQRTRQENLEKVELSHLSPFEQTMQRFVTSERAKGVDVGSVAFEKAYRAKAADTAKRFAPNKELGSAAIDAYTKKTKQFTENGVAANIKLGAQQKSKKTLQTADTIKENYKNSMLLLGADGGIDTDEFTKAEIEKIEKKLDEVSIINGQIIRKDEALLNIMMEGKMANAIGLARNNPLMLENILTNNESYEGFMGPSVVEEMLKHNKQAQIMIWEEGKITLQAQMAALNPNDKGAIKNISSEIEELEDKIISIDDDKEFREKTLDALRSAFSKSLEKSLNKDLGERLIASRERIETTKMEYASQSFTTFDPDAIKKQYEMSREAKRIDEDLKKYWKDGKLVSQGQTPITEEEPKISTWEKAEEEYQGYWDNISRVSPIRNSDLVTREDINGQFIELLELLDSPVADDDKIIGSTSFLYNMSKASLTQDERDSFSALISNMMALDGAQAKVIRKTLQGPSIQMINKGKKPTTHMPPFAFAKTSNELALSDFDDIMRRTQNNFQALSVISYANGATPDDVIALRKQMFDDAIVQFYNDRYAVDLFALDKKLEKKEPAIQKIEGIAYEYKGRDSWGRPIWRDGRVLNVNASFKDLVDRVKFGVFGNDEK